MDLIFVGILIIFSIFGFLKGGLKSFLSISLTILSLVLSFLLMQSFYRMLYDIDIIRNTLTNCISKGISNISPYFSMESSNISDLIGLVESSDMNGILKSIFKLLLSNITIDGMISIANLIALRLTRIILLIVSFVLLFIGFTIITRIIELVISKLFFKNKIGLVNRFVGLLMGMLKGVILCGVVFFVFSSLASVVSIKFMDSLMQDSSVTSFLYKNLANNIFARLMKFV